MDEIKEATERMRKLLEERQLALLEGRRLPETETEEADEDEVATLRARVEAAEVECDRRREAVQITTVICEGLHVRAEAAEAELAALDAKYKFEVLDYERRIADMLNEASADEAALAAAREALGGHYRPGEVLADTIRRVSECADSSHLARDEARSALASARDIAEGYRLDAESYKRMYDEINNTIGAQLAAAKDELLALRRTYGPFMDNRRGRQAYRDGVPLGEVSGENAAAGWLRAQDKARQVEKLTERSELAVMWESEKDVLQEKLLAAHQKIANQAERIRILEGPTNHAGGLRVDDAGRLDEVAIVLLDNFGDLGDFCWEKLDEETREEWREQARDVLTAVFGVDDRRRVELVGMVLDNLFLASGMKWESDKTRDFFVREIVRCANVRAIP